jgi:hypothetical protein
MENAIMEFVIEKFEQFCDEENYQKVKDYLTQLKGLANYNNGYFFEIVADKGNLELIKLFVQNGADIHVDNNYVLYTCAYHNHSECVHMTILGFTPVIVV